MLTISEIKSKCYTIAHPNVVQKDFAWKSALALKIAIETLEDIKVCPNNAEFVKMRSTFALVNIREAFNETT